MTEQSPALEEPRGLRSRTRWGIAATVLWAALWVLIVWQRWESARSMDLNQWGDFFAGVIAPIAFLWLILGYFQQGDELAQNTNALRAQERELKRQAEETANLVQQYARQAEASAKLAELSLAEHDRAERERLAALRPRFRVRSSIHQAGRQTAVRMDNAGGTAHRLELEPLDMLAGQIIPPEIIDRGATFEVQLTHTPLASMSDRLRFGIRCSDASGAVHNYRFVLKGNATFPDDEEEPSPG